MPAEDLHLNLRNLTKADYPAVKKLMDRVYDDIGGAWPQETIVNLIDAFHEGQICMEDGDEIVGIALTVRVNHRRFSNPHTYDDLIGKRMQVLHNPKGEALYGLDVLIHPDYRGYRLGRRMYDARKELCRNLNLIGILAGGRIPGYHKFAAEMSAQDYIEAVRKREIYDPILTFQLSNDFQVKRVLRSYIPEDDKSHGYATLLEWNNIFYQPSTDILGQTKTQVRVGVVQWQMRAFQSVEEVLQQVEYFVDAVSEYGSDFVVFPEFFNAPLMGLTDSSQRIEAIRFLASFTERFRDEMQRMSVEYNINIVTGSMPLLQDEKLYNIAFLCHRDGSVDTQYKLHITPHERWHWVIEGGEKVQVFNTDAGRVGILICYDVEFPELSRLMADEGMDILFVPFWTDTKNGFLRVRLCAQARAIENECYTVICGSVGNLPSVESLDVQYAQSAVFTPSDFSFPHDAILSEATPNTEMILFSDLDLDKLTAIRNEGSVTNMKDRRSDLYHLSWRDDTVKQPPEEHD